MYSTGTESKPEKRCRLFVLDDGWFGHRTSDAGSMGDWEVDKKKLPQGLDHLVQNIHDLDMKFG